MKKQLYWILPGVVLIFVFILYTFVPYVYTFWFKIRHVLIYGLAIYVLLLIFYRLITIVRLKYHLPRIVNIVLFSILSTMMILIAFILSTLQMRYIEYYEVPPLERCSYYDIHGNFLYVSQYDGSCPDLEDVMMTTEGGKDILTFRVDEEIFGDGRIITSVDGGIASLAFEIDATLHTIVSIQYSEKRLIEEISITSYEIQHRINDYDHSKTTYGKMMSKTVTNLIGEDTMQVTMRNATYETTMDGHKDVSFPEVDMLTYEIVTLTSTLRPKDDYTSYIDIQKSWIEDGEELTDVFIKGQYTTINSPLFTLDFYTEDRTNGTTLNAYFDYDQISFKQEEELSISYGVDRTTHTRYISFVETPRVFYNLFEETDFFVSKDFTFQTNPESHLSKEITTNYMTVDDQLYAMNDDQTSKYYKTSYGYKIEDYSTLRYSNGSYYPDFDFRPTYQVNQLFNTNTGYNFENYYNYETFLQTPGVLSYYHFYQVNFLLEGHFYQK